MKKMALYETLALVVLVFVIAAIGFMINYPMIVFAAILVVPFVWRIFTNVYFYNDKIIHAIVCLVIGIICMIVLLILKDSLTNLLYIPFFISIFLSMIMICISTVQVPFNKGSDR